MHQHFLKTSRRLLAVAAFAFLGSNSKVFSQAPLIDNRVGLIDDAESVEASWKMRSSQAALEAGLPFLAESLLVDSGSEGIEALTSASPEVILIRAKAYIAQQEFSKARSYLDTIDTSIHPQIEDALQLYRLIARYELQERATSPQLVTLLDSINPVNLAREERPWFHLMQALLLNEDFDSTIERLERSRITATSASQRRMLELRIVRNQLLEGHASEALASDLAKKLAKEKSDDRFQLIREYAVVLNELDRADEAVMTIDEQIAKAGSQLTASQRDELRLLKALILDPKTLSGRLVLQSLILSGNDVSSMSIALSLLSQSTESDEDMFQFLAQIIELPEPHPLLGQIYYLRSQLAIQYPDRMALAVEDAETLLEQFPGLSEITNVYRLLAYAALQKDPPQYRTAADLLIQLRDEQGDASSDFELSQLIGDAYFMNRDYLNATEFYNLARGDGMQMRFDSEALLRLVVAYIRTDQLETALQLIDEADFSGQLDPIARWKLEWNVSQALRSAGREVEAIERVRLLIGDPSDQSVPLALDLRLRWLEAQLSLESEQMEKLSARVSELLERATNLPEDAIADSELTLLQAELLLLRGGVAFKEGDQELALQSFEQLREIYPLSGATQRSYLSEAAFYSEIGTLNRAQRAIVTLADIYPDSELAAQALYQGAAYAEQRGSDQFGEAVRLLARLAEDYPQSVLYYRARLKQGDLLRLMNDFAGALILYEDLIVQSPGHPLRFHAELARSDSMLALAGNDRQQLADVSEQYERLLDLPNLSIDLIAEATHKWARTLEKRALTKNARDVLEAEIGKFLVYRSEGEAASPIYHYWTSRSILLLGSLLESEGETDAARKLYRKIIAYDLPGRHLAQARSDQIVGRSSIIRR